MRRLKGVEHHCEIEEARPGRDVGDIRNPQPVRRLCGKVTLDQVWRLTAALQRRDDEPAAGHTGNTSARHQPRDALATDTNALGRQLGTDARCAIGAAGARMGSVDLGEQRRILFRPL